MMDEKAGEGHAEKKHNDNSRSNDSQDPPNYVVPALRLRWLVYGRLCRSGGHSFPLARFKDSYALWARIVSCEA
jgi:hypothetical protein